MIATNKQKREKYCETQQKKNRNDVSRKENDRQKKKKGETLNYGIKLTSMGFFHSLTHSVFCIK